MHGIVENSEAPAWLNVQIDNVDFLIKQNFESPLECPSVSVTLSLPPVYSVQFG